MSTIITTNDLNTYTGKTLVSGIATSVVAAVNKWVESRTHRVWGEVNAVTNERYDFKGVLWLRHQDIVSIDGITLGYPNHILETIDPSNYFFNALGRLTLYWGAHVPQSKWQNDILAISYTYGVQAVPDDLKQAALAIAARLYNFATNDGKDIVSTAVGSYRVETIQAVRGTSGAAANPSNNTADLLFAVVDSYKMQRF